jgi:acyl-CoA reductase-like NAD-dependent aldehyde dehydrogenase
MKEKNINYNASNEVDVLVQNALGALEEFLAFDQEKIDYIVAKCSVAGIDSHGSLALKAIEETKRGVFEDKATKNLFACEYVVNNMRQLKTVGVISEDSVTGITEIAEPVGVVAGITPVTNPTSTVIFKSLICLKTRNPIIFAFHPSAQKCSVAALDAHGDLAKIAIEETKRGVFEDKATKNLFACEYIVNNMRHLKTVGVISEDEVTGITQIAEPIGVIAGITPVTNPTSTTIFKALTADITEVEKSC